MLTKNIEAMKIEVARHIAADAVIQGEYWDEDDASPVGGRGCFIGCLTHSNRAEGVAERFNMPLPLVKIAKLIFENLPADEAKEFFAAIPEAIGTDGRDLTRCHWSLLADMLRHLPPQTGDVKAAIDRVIAGMDLLAAGQEWADAADAARAADAAADAAYAAADAAADAAYAAARAAYAAAHAADAAHAAYDAAYAAAEIRRQRDSFLTIIKAA